MTSSSLDCTLKSSSDVKTVQPQMELNVTVRWFGGETDAEPVCSGSDAAEAPPRGKQGHQSVVWVWAVLDTVKASAETAS